MPPQIGFPAPNPSDKKFKRRPALSAAVAAREITISRASGFAQVLRCAISGPKTAPLPRIIAKLTLVPTTDASDGPNLVREETGGDREIAPERECRRWDSNPHFL